MRVEEKYGEVSVYARGTMALAILCRKIHHLVPKEVGEISELWTNCFR